MWLKAALVVVIVLPACVAGAVVHGVRIPLEGEVAWELADGLQPYWRGRIKDIAYEFVR